MLRRVLGPSLGRDFTRLWLATSISNTGDGVTLAAGPLLVASYTKDPAAVAGAAFMLQLPWLLFALLSGAIVDRIDRRRLIAVVDLARGLAVGGLAVAVATHHAGIPTIYAAMFCLGLGDTLANTAAVSFIPTVVTPADLPRANARIMGSRIVGDQMAGPPAGAYLFVLAAAIPFAYDAVTFVVAAVLIATLRPHAAPVAREVSTTTLRAEIAEGVRWLLGHRMLRMLALCICMMNITLTGALAILVLYARQRLGVGPVGFGWLLASMAVGGIVGAVVVGRLTKRFGVSLLLRVGLLIEAGTHLSLALTHHAWVAGLTLAIFSVHGSIWGVVTLSLRQSLVPERLLGRVNSVYYVFAVGGSALGALGGGFLARSYGLTAPFWVSFFVVAALAVRAWPLFRRVIVEQTVETPPQPVAAAG